MKKIRLERTELKIVLCILYLCFSVSGLTFMKLGSEETAKTLFSMLGMRFTVQSIIGYACYIVSFLIYTVVITKFELTYIIPLLGGIVNIAIVVIGIRLLHEKVSAVSLIGIGMTICGIALMNIKK